MIVYESNHHWLKDIFHLARSWTMRKIIRSVILIGLFTTGMCFLFMYGFPEIKIPVGPGMFSLLGVVLSILLVFRTNSAYDRWWEGRKQWGALVNNCRNLAIMVDECFPKDDLKTRQFMAKNISNFCIALKEHLRDGTKLEELLDLTDEEIAIYKKKKHIPNYIAKQIFAKLQAGYRAGALTGEDILNLKVQWQSLLDILGACERIKKTPIPFSYNVYLKIFISVYALALPFGLMAELEWYTIPITMFIFFSLIGVEMMAEEIEDPFSLMCNALPTGNIAHTIKDNVYEIMDLEHEIEPSHTPELYEKIF